MKRACVALALMVAVPTCAGAQVRTDTRALDALSPAKKPAHAAPSHAAPAHRAAATPPHHHAAAARAPVRTAAARPLPGRIPAPSMAAHPPPPPVIAPPPLHVPLHPPPPPPPVPVDPKAPGTAAAIPGGTRLTFGADGAALNPSMMDALHAESAAMKQDADAVATIDAYAAGAADDPSTPRRLSLQRALAARAVLINDGIPSPRIYARALGVPAQNGAAALPVDRIDLTLGPQGGGAQGGGPQGGGAQGGGAPGGAGKDATP